MFIRLKKTPNSTKTAVQLVESIRTGKAILQECYAILDTRLKVQKSTLITQ
ncbi:MAG: hypothetical protein ABI378_14300 [Chitinophagaceae bacterium]